MRGPTTPARVSPEVAPKTPAATAIASSKSFEATVEPMLDVWAQGSRISLPTAKPAFHMIAKWASSGSACRYGESARTRSSAVASGSCKICHPPRKGLWRIRWCFA
jgi:hypothetical protein